MKKLTLSQVIFAGLFAALAFVGTMLIQIPIGGGGYIHIGDTIVYLCGIFLGPVVGGLAAAIGSSLADLATGWGAYAPATFVIKGMDAFVTGLVFRTIMSRKDMGNIMDITVAFISAIIFGGAVMVSGYFVYDRLFLGDVAAITYVMANATQAVGGGILALPLLIALKKAKLQIPVKK